MDFTYESLKAATSTDTVFCRSLVSTGMLTEEQTRRAAGRYCLGRSRDGGVVKSGARGRENSSADGVISHHRAHNLPRRYAKI